MYLSGNNGLFCKIFADPGLFHDMILRNCALLKSLAVAFCEKSPSLSMCRIAHRDRTRYGSCPSGRSWQERHCRDGGAIGPDGR